MHFLAWLCNSFKNWFCSDCAMGNSLWPMKKCIGLLDDVFLFSTENISCITQQLKGICSCAPNPIVQLTRGIIDFLCFLPLVSNYCCGSQENNSFGKQVEHNNSQTLCFPSALYFHCIAISAILNSHSSQFLKQKKTSKNMPRNCI